MKRIILTALTAITFGGLGFGQSSQTYEAEGENSASLNLKNSKGFWHMSGPRSYEGNDNYSIMWNNGNSYSRYFTISSNGHIGIGTTNPRSILHVSSPSRSFNEGNQSVSANLLIEGTNTTRTTGAGAVLGFAIPANTDGSNLWQQGRIYVGADNTNNGNAEGRMYLQTRYRNDGTWSWRNNLVLRPTGNVGVGTQSPDELLTVKGKIHAEEVRVDLSVPADYVFEKYYTGESQLKADYVMPTLEEVEAFTKVNNHLPNIPSAQKIQEEGLHLKEMTNLLLQKIEELTLYTIEQQKEIKSLKAKVTQLEKSKL